mgnify:CR=1 FL=1
MKKLLYLTCSALLTFSMLKVSAQSGKTGKLNWNISDGTLTISGIGAMPNYKYKQRKYRIISPWYFYLNNIKSIVICEGVTSFGENAFYVYYNDLDVMFTNYFDSDNSIDENFTKYCGVTSVSIPNSVVSIGRSAFRNCRNLTSISVPNSVSTIGRSAFSACSKLTSLNLPNSITIVESYLCRGCSSLNSITIPNSVTYIRYSAFSGCHSLKFVVIPNSVTRIGGHAFAFCKGLTSITIPDSVLDIDNSILLDCENLSEIINYAIVPQTLRPYKVFSNLNTAKCILRVPESALEAYKGAEGWEEFERIEAISN